MEKYPTKGNLIKSYIDNNLNSIKVNMTDPIKDNFIQPLTIK